MILAVGLCWLDGDCVRLQARSQAPAGQNARNPLLLTQKNLEGQGRVPLAAPSTRSDTIVSPAWVKAQQAAQDSGLVVLEASWAPAEDAKDYLRGHVPGAIHVNTDDFENGYPRWHLRSVPELHRVIGRLGISPKSTVVVYGKQAIAAARVWWILRYAGVSYVRFLNGGYEAWTRAGFSGETTPRQPQPVRFSAPVRSEYLATTDYVRQRLRTGQAWLADVRSRKEYLGQISGYSYLDFKGRIPGSTHLGNADDAAAVYLNRDGTLRSLEEIRALWREQGLFAADGSFNREVIFYCGGGWRSSLAFLYAWMMNSGSVRNYSGGWLSWSTRHVPDPKQGGTTPGWRQERTKNPVSIGLP